MIFRSPAARIAMLCSAVLIAAAAPSRAADAAEFIDAADRHIELPPQLGRLAAANTGAEALIFVLAPERLAGYTKALTREQRSYIPPRFANLPVTGDLTEANSVPSLRGRADVIILYAKPAPELSGKADAIQQKYGLPVLVFDDSFERIPDVLRTLGGLMGVGKRADDLAEYGMRAIDDIRGRLLIRPASERPRVYYGIGDGGLQSGLLGSEASEAVEQAGAINVAASLGKDTLATVTRQQIQDWNPVIVIAEQRRFYDALRSDPAWRGLAAYRDKRIYLAPDAPWGWIDNPASVNRLIGLYWLSAVFYPDIFQEDVRAVAREFYDKFYGVKLTDKQVEALVKTAEARSGETRRAPGASPFTPGSGMPPSPQGAGLTTTSPRSGDMPSARSSLFANPPR